MSVDRTLPCRLVPILLTLLPLLLAACGSQPPRPVDDRREPPVSSAPVSTPAKPKAAVPGYALKRGGGFYKDDGPGDNPPEDIEAIPDAVPKAEPLHRFANNPYSVLGRDYAPLRALGTYRARGTASWYGRKFHGQRTSSGEPYDMYGMTAAHPTLPIPSYARISNPENGKSVVVRINDRGPFHSDRIIDLSYSAAWKLGLVGNGSGTVEVESLVPGQDTQVARAMPVTPPATPTSTVAPPPDPVRVASVLPVDKALPQEKDVSGTWLQLGAFGNRDNAEAMRSRLSRELGTLGEKLAIHAADKLFRLRLGPWADATEARRVAESLAETLDIKPVVVVR